MKQGKIFLGFILGFLACNALAMDSQFGYYESQNLKVDVNLKVENGLDQAIMAELRSNHFDKSFCPTTRVPIAAGQVKDISLEINGRCIYGKFKYTLTVSDSSQQQAASHEIMGGYEESTINSIPVELNDTYVIGTPGRGCREFCTIKKASGSR